MMDEDFKEFGDRMIKQIDDEIKKLQQKLENKKLTIIEIKQLGEQLEFKQFKKFSYGVTLKTINIIDKLISWQDSVATNLKTVEKILKNQVGKNTELEKLFKDLKENNTTIQKNYSLIHGLKLDISGFKNALGLDSSD